jgi:hypothetical protein
VGRRLRFQLDYCLEINALTRGLPWPPTEPEPSQDGVYNEVNIVSQQESASSEDGEHMDLDRGNSDGAGKPYEYSSEESIMPTGSTEPLCSDSETMQMQQDLASEVCVCELE